MGAKYYSGNSQHRVWLAQNILKILPKWGFEIDETRSASSWEFIVSRVDRFNPNKRIVVFTSIDRISGACRPVGTDAIRVIIERVDGSRHKKIRRINRYGEFRAIVDRMIDGVKTAQKERI